MRLKWLEITDFRSIRHLVIDLREANALALFGLNGQGKSSVLYALQLLFHGKTALVAKPKMDEYIRDGAKAASIKVVIDRWRVELTVKRRGANTFEIVDDESGEIASETGREGLWRLLGIKPSHAAVAMMPDAYLCSRELGGILADLLGEGVTNAAVLEKSGSHREWLKSYLSRGSFELTSVSDLQGLGKKVEADRRELNKDIDFCKSRMEAMGYVGSALDYKGQNREVSELPEIRKTVERLESRRSGLLEEKGRAGVAPVDVEELAAVRGQHARLEAALQEAVAAHTSAKEELEANVRLESSAKMSREFAEKGVKAASKDLDSVVAQDVCPHCGREYTPELREALREPCEQALTEATDHLDGIRRDIENILGVREGLRLKVKETEEAEAEARRQYEAVQGEYAKLEAQREIAASVRAAEEVEAELKDVEEKLARGKALIEALERVDERGKYKTDLRGLESQREHFDWAVQAFRDGVIAKELMGTGLEDFSARANGELAPFGYDLKVRVEGKEVDVLLRCPESDEYRLVGHCSDGQRKLAEFAVGSAFADGGSPLMLDNLNELDGPARKLVLKRFRERSSDGTVIVAAAWQQSKMDMEKVIEALRPVKVCLVTKGAIDTGGPVEKPEQEGKEVRQLQNALEGLLEKNPIDGGVFDAMVDAVDAGTTDYRQMTAEQLDNLIYTVSEYLKATHGRVIV